VLTQAETHSGRVEGEKRDRHSVFRGIPFARPPVGSLRFRAPEPVEPWPGVRLAHEFGPSAPQGLAFAPGVSAEGPTSEDCLYLNVFTPAPDGRRRPVMFWIHGGAFTVGSASADVYDGGKFSELGDLVVVTANYRLGALGFLDLGEQARGWGASANAGLLDQIAALEWVRDNIEGFGGDPSNVTLFGESAGATAVSLLLTASRASGLFHRAIAQSSAAGLSLPEPERALRTTAAFLAGLGVSADDGAGLQALPVDSILRAQAALETTSKFWRGFFPVQDAATLPRHPREVFQAGAGATVPLVMGTNRDEWNLFMLPSIREWNEPMDDGAAVAALGNALPRVGVDRARAMLHTYRDSRASRDLPHGNRALLRAIDGDIRFRIPSLRFAEAHVASNNRAFQYLFTYESPAMRGVLGACHALELPFVFGTLDAPQQDRFAGKGPAVEGLSRAMMNAWVAFARTGDPSHAGIEPWRPYDAERRAAMIFDVETRPENAPYDEERRAWDDIDLE
jgi:para-nitrobenzyl esterase